MRPASKGSEFWFVIFSDKSKSLYLQIYSSYAGKLPVQQVFSTSSDLSLQSGSLSSFR
jgi:hypothetical protein